MASEGNLETYVSGSHDTTNLLHGVQIWAKASVHGENLLVDDCCDGQAVETIRERLPKLDVIPPLALIVEAVDAVDGGAFVVAAQDEEVFGVFNLVGKE